MLPNIDSSYRKERATDELPQSAAGRTIMTTEPKFIPEQAVTITVDGTATMNVRMIDCVGYIVPSSLGYIEDNAPRMVKTPWFEEEIPFNMAAEIGTQKVINEHSTIGLVVTTDGSITEIPREEYAEAEERVVSELKEINKPFIILLNTTNPASQEAIQMAEEMENRYGVQVYPVNCLEMTENEIRRILEKILFEFPVREIGIELPKWLTSLDKEHPIRRAVFDTVRAAAEKVTKISNVSNMTNDIVKCEYVDNSRMTSVELGTGKAGLNVSLSPNLFYKVLGETTGLEIDGEAALMSNMVELAAIKKKYDKIKNALDEVEATGYGIVMPALEEMTLDEPEIIRQSGRYGIRLRAQAPSIHMLKADITTEVSPIVGSERQSEDLVNYLLREFDENPSKIWESNIFGTSLWACQRRTAQQAVQDAGRRPHKAKETVERIINEGCSGDMYYCLVQCRCGN